MTTKNVDRYWGDIQQRVNPQNKKFTWGQMMEHRRRESEGEVVEELQERVRHGICVHCGGGKFRQVMRNRELVRICKTASCQDEMIV